MCFGPCFYMPIKLQKKCIQFLIKHFISLGEILLFFHLNISVFHQHLYFLLHLYLNKKVERNNQKINTTTQLSSEKYVNWFLRSTYSGTCLIWHTNGPGKFVGFYMSEYSGFYLVNRYTFLSDVTGCWKSQVSDSISSTCTGNFIHQKWYNWDRE